MSVARTNLRRTGTLALGLPTLLAVLLEARPALAGYTHYWRWRGRPAEAALRGCVEDMSRIVEARRGLLVDGHGRTGSAAVFRESQTFFSADAGALVPAIVFNGIGDDGHEAFGFPLAPFTQSDPGLQFVKTAGKPYDEVAVACLLAARDCFPRDVLAITSDGEWPASFADGAALYEKTLGRHAKNPLDEPASVLPAPRGGGENVAAVPGARPNPARQRLLLGLILALAVAIGFVLTREAR